MTPKFTTPCFIRKNTPELRKKLEELGYIHSQKAGWEDKHIDKCRLLWTEWSGSFWHHYIESCPKTFFKTHIDCGENEQLFLALAALREDSDKFQWFYDNNGLWEMSESDLPSRYMQMNGHKATPEELIEYFKQH